MIPIIELLRRAYPRFIESSAFEPDIKKTAYAVVDLWTQMFSDISVEIVAKAVELHIKNSRYLPSIAEIRSLAKSMMEPDVTPGMIWEECHRLLNWDIQINDEARAYENMSDVCRDAVLACGGWKVLSMSSENDTYIRSTFLKAADARLKRDRELGIAFDDSKVNKLVPVDDVPLLMGGDVCE